MNLTAISALLAGAIGFGAAWRIQGATITEMELSNAQQRIELQRAARQQIEKQVSRVEASQASAVARTVVIRNDRVAVAAGLVGLRDTSAAALRAAEASRDACIGAVQAFAVVSGQCSGVVEEMAGTLDQCFSDRQTLIDSWPR